MPILKRAENDAPKNGTENQVKSAANAQTPPPKSQGQGNSTAPAPQTSAPAPNSPPANATSNAPTPTADNEIEQTGAAAAGATATITADTVNGVCTMSNDLDASQQASWTDAVITTCCAGDQASACWFRIQDGVKPEDACKIPTCGDLNSNDPDRMVGFRPLSGSIGSGKYQNIFPFLFLNGSSRPVISALLFIVAPFCVSFMLLL